MIERIWEAIQGLVRYLANHHDDTTQQLNRIFQQLGEIMATLDDLKASVANETSVIASAVTLINGFAAKLDAVKTDPAAIDALIEQTKGSADSLAAAVAANTPAAPPPAAATSGT